jgi:uncharacterized protein
MQMKELLTPPKVVAVVGLSDKPERPSYEVASYLIDHGFTVVPVNPNITEFLGIQAYPSLLAIPSDIPIDIVDIFRKSEEVPQIVREIIQIGRSPVIWMQEGVVSAEAETEAQSRGMQVIMDTCIMKTHRAVAA